MSKSTFAEAIWGYTVVQCTGCSQGVAFLSVSLFKNRMLASCWAETIKQMTFQPQADFEKHFGLQCILLVQRTQSLCFIFRLFPPLGCTCFWVTICIRLLKLCASLCSHAAVFMYDLFFSVSTLWGKVLGVMRILHSKSLSLLDRCVRLTLPKSFRNLNRQSVQVFTFMINSQNDTRVGEGTAV